MNYETTTVEPRIYVASLSDYNGGRLHGVFIDIDGTTTVDDIWDQVEGMLRSSPEFKEFPQGGPAEEWAIHDYEGFEGIRLGESESFDKVLMMAQNIIQYGEAWAIYAKNVGAEEASEHFTEAYQGEWDSFSDFVEDFVDSTGMLNEMPEDLRRFFDYEAYGRELEQSLTIEQSKGYSVYIFSEV
jgi:antirestriction protein